MHNGDIGDFRAVRRALLSSVCDEAFGNVYGSTDSEHFFALYIDAWLASAERDPAQRMALALNAAIARTLALARDAGRGSPSYLNVAIADGDRAVVSRFTDDDMCEPESLYYFCGPLYPELEGVGTPDGDAVTVSSERLTQDAGWNEVPSGHIIVLERKRVPRLLPICASMH
jgi:predicted glutamine amidotransferase